MEYIKAKKQLCRSATLNGSRRPSREKWVMKWVGGFGFRGGGIRRAAPQSARMVKKGVPKCVRVLCVCVCGVRKVVLITVPR